MPRLPAPDEMHDDRFFHSLVDFIKILFPGNSPILFGIQEEFGLTIVLEMQALYSVSEQDVHHILIHEIIRLLPGFFQTNCAESFLSPAVEVENDHSAVEIWL